MRTALRSLALACLAGFAALLLVQWQELGGFNFLLATPPGTPNDAPAWPAILLIVGISSLVAAGFLARRLHDSRLGPVLIPAILLVLVALTAVALPRAYRAFICCPGPYGLLGDVPDYVANGGEYRRLHPYLSGKPLLIPDRSLDNAHWMQRAGADAVTVAPPPTPAELAVLSDPAFWGQAVSLDRLSVLLPRTPAAEAAAYALVQQDGAWFLVPVGRSALP